MIDAEVSYIQSHGLGFNAGKKTDPSWTIFNWDKFMIICHMIITRKNDGRSFMLLGADWRCEVGF